MSKTFIKLSQNIRHTTSKLPILSDLGRACNRDLVLLPDTLSQLSNTTLAPKDAVKTLLTLSYLPHTHHTQTTPLTKKLKQNIIPFAKTLSSDDLQALVYAELRAPYVHGPFIKFLLNETIARGLCDTIRLVHGLLPHAQMFDEYLNVLIATWRIVNSKNFRELSELMYVREGLKEKLASDVNRTVKMKITKVVKQNKSTVMTPASSDSGASTLSKTHMALLKLFPMIQYFALADVLANSTIDQFVNALKYRSITSDATTLGRETAMMTANIAMLKWILERRGVLSRLSPETQELVNVKLTQPLWSPEYLGVVDPPNSRASNLLRRAVRNSGDQFYQATIGPFVMAHVNGKKRILIIPGEDSLTQPSLKKLRSERNQWLRERSWNVIEWRECDDLLALLDKNK
jgi:hypothetical protein